MCDLNIIAYQNGERTPDHDVLTCMKKAFRLGYNIIALNVIVNEKELTSKNPLPSPIKFDIPDFCLKEARAQSRTLRVLTRLSGKISDNQQSHKLQLSPVSKEYDLIAVQPTTEALLSSIINGGNADIIYYDLSYPLQLPKMASVRHAIQKDLCIEMMYCQLMEEKMRLTALRQMRQLVTRFKKGFILSSGVSDCDKIRGPLDVSFLGYLLDLSADSCRTLVWDTPKKTIIHAETRKRQVRGIVLAQFKHKIPQGEKWLIEACDDVPAPAKKMKKT